MQIFSKYCTRIKKDPLKLLGNYFKRRFKIISVSHRTSFIMNIFSFSFWIKLSHTLLLIILTYITFHFLKFSCFSSQVSLIVTSTTVKKIRVPEIRIRNKPPVILETALSSVRKSNPTCLRQSRWHEIKSYRQPFPRSCFWCELFLVVIEMIIRVICDRKAIGNWMVKDNTRKSCL